MDETTAGGTAPEEQPGAGEHPAEPAASDQHDGTIEDSNVAEHSEPGAPADTPPAADAPPAADPQPGSVEPDPQAEQEPNASEVNPSFRADAAAAATGAPVEPNKSVQVPLDDTGRGDVTVPEPYARVSGVGLAGVGASGTVAVGYAEEGGTRFQVTGGQPGTTLEVAYYAQPEEGAEA